METTEKPVTLEALRLASDGSGVGYCNGLATFVPGLLPGETGEVAVQNRKKNFQRAKLVRITRISGVRQSPPCRVFSLCGGCQLQHMTYEETLLWKSHWVEDALQRMAKVDVPVEPALAMDFPWRYRNKASLHWTQGSERKGAGQLGYYEGKSHSKVIFPDCLLLSERMNTWIRGLESVLPSYREIQEVVFRETSLGEGSIILKAASEEWFRSPSSLRKASSKLENTLTHALPELTSAWAVGPSGKPVRLWGRESMEVCFADLRFQVSPFAFLQVNFHMTEKLYGLVLKLAALKGRECVWDLYSGIGTLTLALARQAGETWGIEENPYAVEDAKRNAVLNGLEKVEFLQGKVEEQLSKLTQKPDLVIMDPPRAGAERVVLDHLIRERPARIIYVSCDPGTLARDVSQLVNGGYEVDVVQPVDMFPWTRHVETIVRLNRKHNHNI